MSGARLIFPILVFAAACGGRAVDDVSSPGGAPSPAATVDPAGTPETGKCDARSVDVSVAKSDLNGYPPYALSGCSLAYITTDGALVLRDLATGTEETLAAASEGPRRPAASPSVIAWEAMVDHRLMVRVRLRSTRETKTIEGPLVAGGEPRVAGTSVAFTAWVTADDADVWLYDANTTELRSVFAGKAEQRFADISDAFIVATDFSEDPDGKYDGAGDLADIVVFDRATQMPSKRLAPKKQAFPLIVDGTRLSYLEWNLVHPEPKLEGYALRVGAIVGSYADDATVADIVLMTPEPVRPSTANGMLEWIANPNGVTTLYRAPADRSQPPQAVAGLDGLHLYAPVSTSAFTVMATVPTDRTEAVPLLRAVAR